MTWSPGSVKISWISPVFHSMCILPYFFYPRILEFENRIFEYIIILFMNRNGPNRNTKIENLEWKSQEKRGVKWKFNEFYLLLHTSQASLANSHTLKMQIHLSPLRILGDHTRSRRTVWSRCQGEDLRKLRKGWIDLAERLEFMHWLRPTSSFSLVCFWFLSWCLMLSWDKSL